MNWLVLFIIGAFSFLKKFFWWVRVGQNLEKRGNGCLGRSKDLVLDQA